MKHIKRSRVRKPLVVDPTNLSVYIFRVNGLGAVKSTDNIIYNETVSPLTSVYGSVLVDGKLTIVGTNNNGAAIMSSIDGVIWIAANLPIGLTFRSITYGNGVYVATENNNGRLRYSTDAINWTLVMLPGTGRDVALGRRSSVCFGNGLFVTYDTNDKVYTSVDGVTWTYLGLIKLNMISFTNGSWYAGGIQDDVHYRSVDGYNWVIDPAYSRGTFGMNVAYNGDRYWTVLYGGYVISSPDGINWVNVIRIGQVVGNIVVKGDTVIVTDYSASIYVSHNKGVTWNTYKPVNQNGSLNYIALL